MTQFENPGIEFISKTADEVKAHKLRKDILARWIKSIVPNKESIHDPELPVVVYADSREEATTIFNEVLPARPEGRYLFVADFNPELHPVQQLYSYGLLGTMGFYSDKDAGYIHPDQPMRLAVAFYHDGTISAFWEQLALAIHSVFGGAPHYRPTGLSGLELFSYYATATGGIEYIPLSDFKTMMKKKQEDNA